MTPHSYVTRLNHFYARDGKRRTICDNIGDHDKFVLAPSSLIKNAINSGVVVEDSDLHDTQAMISYHGGSPLAPMGWITSRSFLDPIEASFKAVSIMTGCEYLLFLEDRSLVFDEHSPVYRFVRKWIQGYYPQLLDGSQYPG